ncbi:2-C-methyl-D-erythritol 4-phosphate cytidylyltransferase [Corynebacterium sp. zg-331]|uniref:2-C-methyl-D-erythritol 4-phosphate cytidylyltransferase n=1 Tax=unclassified Corynebacterium TaxID=2624378 RepID=UPI00128AFBA9|nr:MULTISPECIES: 2-C-methyl-D-erythritol 4-phosphate cytidylyltransferase [unclassified Corynebacterium]MBC3185688.1 2-C-methyl-D-erythritol 4-phosphate cytidylyltransferase [Corynebacterium sp. zg-331]MPV52181.1 2-C-methyl-D-erythritol 4-phosphate cytidylyltransferase [Corynebacterium sp. zg331]
MRTRTNSRRRVTALIAAAGKGTRLGAEVPKAFVTLRERSLVERSIAVMITSGVVDEIVVLISPEMEAYAADLLGRRGLLDGGEVPVRLVHGGGERADSVWRGLQAIDDTEGVVLIHDSARALTPPGLVARVAREVLAGHVGVVPVLPVADTIKRIDSPGGTAVAETPSRALLRAVQTPQGFDLATLRAANRAYFAAQNPGFEATDDASLLEWRGQPVVCVPGDPMAFKVTTPMDMMLARTIVDEVEPTVFDVPGGAS